MSACMESGKCPSRIARARSVASPGSDCSNRWIGSGNPPSLARKNWSAGTAARGFRQLVISRNLPQAIGAQPPVGFLRMMAPPRRAEPFEQLAQLRLDLVSEPAKSRFLAEQSTQCKQQKQRLVRRSLIPASPSVDPGHQLK